MRTHVEFRSVAFPATEGEEEEVNLGLWGKMLATYLRTELSKRGLPGPEPYPEDWGWAVPLDNSEFPLWVGCGRYQEYPDGFLCFIEPSKPHVRRWFKKIDTQARVEQVANAIDSALRENVAVRDLRWWTEQEV
ncbi:MAG TPA: hypothetical protein VF450_06920 [Noviherbaspirillum sp.]